MQQQPPVRQIPPKKIIGLAIYIHYPEFGELAPFLSDEGKKTFFDGLQSAIKHALLPQPHYIVTLDEGTAIVAVGDLEKSSYQKLMSFAEGVHKDVRLWTGTFGKVGIPPMKFEMGAAVGETIVTSVPQKIEGHALEMATSLAKDVCAHFGVQVALEADLVRFATHLQEWIDIEDFDLSTTPKAPKVSKRIFTKLLDREEPEDLQLLKEARKAYMLKDFATAKTRFDRLSRVRTFKRISEIYLKRLGSRPKS